MEAVPTYPAYQGFILTNEVERITPINPFKLNTGAHGGIKLFRHYTKRWTNVSGKPDQYREITQATEMDHADYTYEIKLYRVWNPADGQQNEKFAFYTDTSKSPKGCFLRIRDLVSRLRGDLAAIEELYKEDWNKEDQEEICIPVWPINGGKAGREQFSWIRRSKRNFVKQFTVHLNIAQRASVSIVEGWSPHLRYWDVGVKAHFLILVNDVISGRVKVEQLTKDIIDNYNIHFKPECKVCGVSDVGDMDLLQYTFLSEHILGFYKTYVLAEDLKGLVDNGAFGEDREFPRSTLIQEIQDKHFGPDEVALVPTSTKVTRTKILGAHQIFRTPQQIAVMNNLATVTIANKFWGNEEALSRKTEWLHRSAFGFGGLGEDGVLPGSSQVIKNLVFGTHEANTLMLRFESSIKNLTIHEDKRTDGNARSRVSTELLFPADIWGDRPKYSWCAPQLQYHWDFWCTPLEEACVGLRNIDLFKMRPPTRFEAYLDELIEDALYEPIEKDKTAPVAIEDTPGLVDELLADEVIYAAPVAEDEI